MSHAVESRESRIAAHRSLCRAAASRFLRAGLERCDLEQTASIGLIKAADRFDPAAGTPFSAFAWPYIVGELMHYVRDHEHLIRLPRKFHAVDRRESRAYEQLLVRLGRIPTRDEIAVEAMIEPAFVDALVCARRIRTVCELDPRESTTSYRATRVDDRAALNSLLEMLESDERTIILGIYALRLTQTEVGRRIGYSQRSASRLHRRALEKLAYSFHASEEPA